MDEFYEGPEDSFDEYGDQDAISCANGDYNAFEEREVFLDHEGDDREYDDYQDDEIDRDCDMRGYYED